VRAVIAPLVTLVALLAGTAIAWLVIRRPLPVAAWVNEPPPAEHAIWFRSARELYRTVQGIVADLDVCASSTPVEPDGPADPTASRAWRDGAVTRARAAADWAVALRDQAIRPEAGHTCDLVAAGLAALADAAGAALADPANGDRARRVDAERDRALRDAESLVRLL
jgi:hypothetical protein